MSTPATTSPLPPTSSNITELAAFTCHTYLDKNEWKEKEKITAVAICDNNVYLGFDTGTVCLYTYQISGDTDEEKSAPPVCIVKKRISKKPITSLHLIPIHEQLLIISDSTLTIHEPITLSKKENVMSNTKHTSNVQMVCVDIKSPHSLCIAPKGKRKLHLYSYSTTSRVYTSLRELMIPDTIVTMSWCGKWLICGYKKEYILMNAETGDVKDVPVPVGDATPNICLPSHHEMLLSTNELGVFMDFHGNPVPKSPIIWSKSPLTMEICSHYVIGILPSGTIEVISVLDARVVQRINMKDGKIMSTWDNQVIVASSQEVTLLRLTSLSDQIHQYLSLTLVDEAYTLLERTHPNQQQLNQFHIDAGFVLLEDLAFHDVMKHWCQTTLDPREWLILFPDLLIKGMPYQFTHSRHPHGTIQTLIDTAKKRIALNEQKRHKSIMSMTQAQLIRQARFQLAVYLWKRRTQTTKEPSNPDIWIAVDTALLFLCVEFGEEMMADDGTTERVLRGGSVDDDEDPDPSSSTHELPFTLEQLLLPSNTCLLTECETFLMKRRQYNALAVLYQSKNMMRKALEVWSRLGSGEFTETENAIIGHTRSTTRLSLNHTETSKKPVEINGVRQTVMLLSTLQDTPLLWEFAEWVLSRDPKQGIKIFTSTSRDNPLPPEKVLHYLKQKQGTKPTEFDLIEAYLEHLIDVEGTRDPKYHNQLALSYFKKVAGLQLPQMKTSTSSAPSSSTPSTSPSTSKRIRPGDEPGLLGLTRGKLYAFLISSHSYTPQELLPHALPTQLWEEICILYGRMNAHIDVLKIYIFQLYDDYAAATYCLDYIKNHPPTITVDPNIAVDPDEQSHPTDVFIDLLQLMFTSEYTSMYDDHMLRITSYLQHYHRYMNPVKVMWIIPDHISVASLMHYFTAVLPHNTHVKRHSQIIKNVSKMNHLKVQDRVMTNRSAVFPIDPTSRCYVCNKPLGDSILSIHPVPPAPLLTIKHHSHQKPSALSQQVRQSMLEQDTRIPKYRVLHYQCASTYRPDVSPNPGSLKVGSLATSTSFGRSPPRADSLDGLDPDIVARRARNNTSYLA